MRSQVDVHGWPLVHVLAAFALLGACKGSGAGSNSESFGHDPVPGADANDGGPGTATHHDGEPGSEPGAPDVPAVQLVGRFDMRDGAGPRCAWPGCRVVARFSGTRVSVKLREILETWMDGGPSEWDISVDGHWQSKIVTDATGAPHDYVLAEGLNDGPHTVEIYKRSEAHDGTTQFLGYDFGGGKLLPPPPRKARRIELIGDSVSSGYGVAGVGPLCAGANYAAKYQNFRLSMGARLGELVDAEVAGTVFAGKGVAKNVWTADKETMPVLYPRALPDDVASTWDFSRFVAEVVIVMLGGNDFAPGAPVDLGPATPGEFMQAYAAFVGTLRASYPAAHLFLTVAPPLSDLDPPGGLARTNVVAGVKAVAAQRNAAGDARVYTFEPAPGDASEHTGCEGHGNPQFHQRVAGELAAEITAKVGWK